MCKAPQTQPGDSSLAEDSMTSKPFSRTSDLFNMTFSKGHCRFIKQHNEHYNHHHSLMLALSQENIIYRPYKNNNTPSASCRDLPSKHISPFSYYSWQLTLSLHLALQPRCFLLSFPFTFVFNSPPLSFVTYCTTHIQSKSAADAS